MGGKGSGRKTNPKTAVNKNWQKLTKSSVSGFASVGGGDVASTFPAMPKVKRLGALDSDGIKVDSDLIISGDVGIGTTSPASELEVKGSPGIIRIHGGGSNSAPKLQFIEVDNGWNLRHEGTDNTLRFADTSGGTDRIIVQPSGDIQFTGEIDANTNKIVNVTDPTANQDAATKKYVDDNAGSSPLTTKGDLFTYSTADARLAVGTDGQHLIADSGETTGLKWVGGEVSVATFDITSNTAVIAAAGAGIKNKIVAISIHNNDSTGTNDTPVKITDGDAGTALYGGGTGHVYLVGRGGYFGLPMSLVSPWFETSNNTALYLNPTNSKRISGAVWYIQEA